ncbi:MAG: FAD-dependent oxidoreductase [Desulfarculaceae bacterium]|nr:FAD-dependent oxidoreductase [Desulfarculaceae bacterium]
MKRYLIIGNGVAGTTAAQSIRELDRDGAVTIVTEESVPFYSRIKLPDYVAGSQDVDDIIIRKDKWYKDQDVELNLDVVIDDIDPELKVAVDRNGKSYPYDTLLLATGSYSFIPPIEGSGTGNVFALKTVADADRIIQASEGIKNATVIGGGLLGLEAGNALLKRGITVSVVEFFDRLLPRQLDTEGAALLQKMMEDMGFVFHLGAKTEKILGAEKVQGVQLDSGSVIDSDLVLFSTGVRSRLELAEKLGVETDKSIVVNASMETSGKGIYAAGDAAQVEDLNFCIWPEAQEQGRVAGINMAGGKESFKRIVPSNRLKVAGINLASAGDIDQDNKLEHEVEKTETVYKKIVKKDGAVVGCIMLGNTNGFSDIVKTMKA